MRQAAPIVRRDSTVVLQRVPAASSNLVEGEARRGTSSVRDKVGNVPTMDDEDTTVNEAPRGAAPPDETADNAFKFFSGHQRPQS